MKIIFYKAPILVFLILLILSSCEFVPDGDYLREIVKTNNAMNLSIETQLSDSGEISIYWETEIALTVNSDTLKVLSVDFYLDYEKLPVTVSGNTYSTKIRLLDDLRHDFKYNCFIKSGTGSIADDLNIEGYYYESSHRIIKLETFDSYLNGKVDVTDKGMLMSWKPYTGPDLKSYIVEAFDTDFNVETKETMVTDTNYLGEQTSYYVYVNTIDGKKHMWTYQTLSSNLPKLTMGEVDSAMVLRWDPYVYKNKIKEYKLYGKKNYDDSWGYLGTVGKDSNYFKLTYGNNYVLGDSYDFRLQIVPDFNVNPKDSELYVSTSRLDVAIPTEIIGYYIASSHKGAITQLYDTIYYYNGESNKLAKLFYAGKKNYIISPNLKYILLKMNNQTYQLYDIDKLQIIKTIQIDEIPNGSIFNYDLTDNGLFTISTIGTSVNPFTCVYDLIVNQIIYQENNYYIPFVSPTGKYFMFFTHGYNQVKLCELVNNTMVKNDSIAIWNNDFLSNIKILDDEYTFQTSGYSGSNIAFWSYAELTKTNAYSTPGYYSIIDFKNDKIASLKNNILYVSDYNSGELLNEIPTSLYLTSDCFLLDNTLYFRNCKYYLPK